MPALEPVAQHAGARPALEGIAALKIRGEEDVSARQDLPLLPANEGWQNANDQSVDEHDAGDSSVLVSLLLLGHPHQLLADVLAVEQADERRGRVFQAIHDGLLVLHLAFLDPLGHLLLPLAEPAGELEHQESLGAGLLDDQVPQQPRATRRPGGVVLVDLAADDDPCPDVDLGEHGVGERPAHVVEVDVDPLGADLLEPRPRCPPCRRP